MLIAVIAVACHSLNGDSSRARFWADTVRYRNARLTQADFFRSFPFGDPLMREQISRALAQFGI